jgi:hypothetical protein
MSSAGRKPAKKTSRRPAADQTAASLSKSQKVERERQRKLRALRKRQWIAGSLFTAGAIVGVSHIVEHAGVFQVFSPGIDDVAIGYPMAGLLVVYGAIKLGPR